MDYFQQKDPKVAIWKIKLVRNGNPDRIVNVTLKQNVHYSQLINIVSEALSIPFGPNQEIIIFRNGGVELEPEEVEYIKDREILYVSLGEEFDEGSVFAEYKIIKELGAGGFGKVFEARHRITKEKVAIKIAEKKSQESAKDVEMMFKEISALKNLKHKNILQIVNAFTLRKEMKVVLVLEFLEGGELKKYLKENKRLDEKEAQFFFKQLYHGISYCHREKIIHRDLKLENIMLTDSMTKQLKVVDFGISGMSHNINMDYTEAGSVRYLAPEVIQYKAPANSAIDIWAMGVILYWLLHGYPPFDGENKQEILEKIVKGEYEVDEHIRDITSKACIDLIEQMLQSDPKNRISIYEMGNHEWLLKNADQILQEEQQEQLEALLKLQEMKVFEQKEKQQKTDSKSPDINAKKRHSFAAPTQSFLNRLQDFDFINISVEKDKKELNSDGQFKMKVKRIGQLEHVQKNEINEFLIQSFNKKS